MNLKNRFVRSATWMGMCDEHARPSQKLIDTTADLARNEVGLIISGYGYVRPDGQAAPYQMGAHSDDLIPDLRRMTDAVHGADGAIVMQIMHGGLYAIPIITGGELFGPSRRDTEHAGIGRAMELGDIEAIIDAFRTAAIRAAESGFDGVQIHAAHGFLLGQFLSPYYNHRTDAYGGSVEK